MGSSFPRVILIGSISVEVPVAPEVGAAAVSSPTRVLELDTHLSSKVDPSESSPPPVSIAPMVLPFLCLDDSESDTEIPKRHASPTTSTLEVLTAPILPVPSAVVAPSFEFRLALGIDREEVDHSSSRHSILGHSLPGHSPPDTIVADSSTPPRFVHPPLARTPQCSEAYLHWRSVPLSTMYPLTTSESSAEDSSSESSAGPSRKRCRSPSATVTSSIHATRSLVPSRADLLPLRKRFRDSILPEDSVEEDIDTDVLADIETDATTDKVAVDRDVEAGVDASIGMEVDVGVDVEDEVEDEVESSDRGTMEVGVDVVVRIDIPDEISLERIEDIEIGQRELEARSLIAGGDKASLLEQCVVLLGEGATATLRAP
ncbi:hypothetical protein Tco_0294947 [Tanacetum coccineum]